MSKPSIFYRAWTYHPTVNPWFVFFTDLQSRINMLNGCIMVRPLPWERTIIARIKSRREFRHTAEDICKRHELARFCALCDDDEV